MDFTKLSASLATAYDQYSADGNLSLTHRARTLGLVTITETTRPTRAVVFVRGPLRSGEELTRLAEAGLELNETGGAAEEAPRTGIVALDALDRISSDPAVGQLIAARRLRPLMDVAPGAVALPEFVRRSGLTGEGVVIGVVDTGIDPQHPAFTGRIERIWDQTLPGSGVPEGRYGAELIGEQIRLSRDTDGHGTHVAGIAAGADATYPGVAPGARLVIVKTDLLDAHIADGVRYCVRVASELGMPVVVNLSLGGHGDPHDGTDPLSQIIDAVSGPGRIVVCAAGNEGNDDIHARTQITQGGQRTITCAAAGPFELNIWYAGADALDIAVAGPSGESTPFQSIITGGSPVRQYITGDGRIRIATPGPDPINGDHNALVLVEPNSSASAPSRLWRLRLRGASVSNGQVDAWILSSPDLPAQFTGRYADDAYKIGSPGAATQAVTAAAYTTKVSWTDIDGAQRATGLEPNDIADFSSEGPRRDEHPKPDVAAPGAMIASALSRNAHLPRALILDREHVVMAGTSMASPFVAGVAALLLQRDPNLDPDGLRKQLRAASSVPGAPPATFDPKWGYGLLSADQL